MRALRRSSLLRQAGDLRQATEAQDQALPYHFGSNHSSSWRWARGNDNSFTSRCAGYHLGGAAGTAGVLATKGKEVEYGSESKLKFTLEKDAEDSASDVTLKKGVNVLVLKVVNEENNWQGSVRFMDKAGKPVTDLKIETKP